MALAPSGVAHPESHIWPPRVLAWRLGGTVQRVVFWTSLVLICLWVVTLTLEQPLRRTLERRINASLKDYTGTIGRVDLHVLGLGLTLHDVTVVQNALPNPPVIYIPRWTTSVQWRALLSGALVANVRFARPAFYITREQAESE